MDLPSLLFVLALILVVISFVAQPFVRGVSKRPAEDGRETLRAEKERLIGLLQDLEQDLALGKVDPESYQSQHAVLAQSAAQVMREIEDRAPAEAEAVIRCPACGRSVRPADRFCSNCGAQLGEAG